MAEKQKHPLTALAWALQYIEDDHHEDLAKDAYARGVLARARRALEDVEALVREFAEVCQVAHQRQRNSMFQRHESDSWMDCPDDKCPKRRTALAKFTVKS